MRAAGLRFPPAQPTAHSGRAGRRRAGDHPVGQRHRHRRRRGQARGRGGRHRGPVHAPDGQHPAEDISAHPGAAPCRRARIASRTRPIRPNPGTAADRHLVAADPGVQPHRRALPVAVGDQQGAALVRARAVTARARVGGTDRPPSPSTTRSMPSSSTAATSTGSAPGSGITREPAQVRTHLHGGQQTDVGLADDRRRDRPPPSPPPPCSAAATGLPSAPPPIPLGNPPGSSSASDSGIGSKLCEAGSRSSTGGPGRAARAHLARHRRHLAAQLLYLLSAVFRHPDPGLMPPSSHTSGYQILHCVRMYVRYSE